MYIPRFLITIPVFSLFFYFLKRKFSGKKAVQVDTVSSTSSELHKNLLKMKLKDCDTTNGIESSMNGTTESMNGTTEPMNGTSLQHDISNGADTTKSQRINRDKLLDNVISKIADIDLKNELINGVSSISNGVESNDEKQSSLHMNGHSKVESDSEVSDFDGLSTTAHNGSLCDLLSEQVSVRTSAEENVEDSALPENNSPESPVVQDYCESVGSFDSGRGASENQYEPYPSDLPETIYYEFEIPQNYVGRLIGKEGKFVKFIKARTEADILVKPYPSNNQTKICTVVGTQEEINAALGLIREKFPVQHYPSLTLTQLQYLPIMPCPENLLLRLPETFGFDTIISATVSAGHFFLRQPSHPTFHSLEMLTHNMSNIYNSDVSAPSLPHMERGYICAANFNNSWYRVEIHEVFPENDECSVKCLDYGGYHIVSRSCLRQINGQFMHVPFQATECYLGLVTVLEGETEWSSEATRVFEELACGCVLLAFVLGYTENGVPLVHLFRNTSRPQPLDINGELVQRGLARYVGFPAPV